MGKNGVVLADYFISGKRVDVISLDYVRISISKMFRNFYFIGL